MIHLREMDGEKAHYACNKAVSADHKKMTIKNERVTCKNCIKIIKKQNPLMQSMMGSIIGLGAISALTGMFGGNKMFGLNDDKGNLKELMNGMVQGFLEHFEYKIEDLKEKIQRLEKEKKEAEEDRNDWKERYEEAMEMLDKNNKKK